MTDVDPATTTTDEQRLGPAAPGDLGAANGALPAPAVSAPPGQTLPAGATHQWRPPSVGPAPAPPAAPEPPSGAPSAAPEPSSEVPPGPISAPGAPPPPPATSAPGAPPAPPGVPPPFRPGGMLSGGPTPSSAAPPPEPLRFGPPTASPGPPGQVPPPGAAVAAPAAAGAATATAVVEQPGTANPVGDPQVAGGRQNQEGTNQSVSTWNMDPVIEMVDVHKAFGSFRVLDGVTFRIPRQGVTVLMGPSGTGKSVSLRHIVGLLMPDKGDIIVDGKHVPKLNEKEILALRRSIGMLFQDGALFSSMNLYDNVAFPLRQHTKHSEGKIREIVMQRLSEVGLAGAEKRQPNELSGGMRKRAGFARALVMEPKILLFDEPDSGLDPVRTTLLCDLIKEISQKYQATSIVISHDVNGVRRMADFIGILYKGKMRHFGTKEEIENSPDEFVKQFFNAESEGPLGMD